MSSAKVGLIAQREWLENVRTKAFWIGLLLFPVILIAGFAVPILIDQNKPAREFAVIDHSGWLLNAVEERAALHDYDRLKEAPLPESERPSLLDSEPSAAQVLTWWRGLTPEDASRFDAGLTRARYDRRELAGKTAADLSSMVANGDLFAYLEIADQPTLDAASNRFVSKNLTDNDLERWFTRLADESIRERAIVENNVDPDLAELLNRGLLLTRSKITDEGEEEDVSVEDLLKQWAPVGFVYLLFLSIFTISQMLLSNTVEEKSNRLMEVLLSSVSPVQLMVGKILGIAATGLTMVLTWVACLALAAMAAPAALAGTKLGIDLSFIFGEPRYIVSFVVYFLLGYLLYASILVAIGSVCSTMKEAQNLQAPITILIMVPLFLMIPIGQDPDGLMARILSYFPPTTPFVMMNRAAGNIPWWEYVATTALLVLSVAAAMWAAAKVFRIGVLMTGKPPRIRDILRWVKAPVTDIQSKASSDRTAM